MGFNSGFKGLINMWLGNFKGRNCRRKIYVNGSSILRRRVFDL